MLPSVLISVVENVKERMDKMGTADGHRTKAFSIVEKTSNANSQNEEVETDR